MASVVASSTTSTDRNAESISRSSVWTPIEPASLRFLPLPPVTSLMTARMSRGAEPIAAATMPSATSARSEGLVNNSAAPVPCGALAEAAPIRRGGDTLRLSVRKRCCRAHRKNVTASAGVLGSHSVKKTAEASACAALMPSAPLSVSMFIASSHTWRSHRARTPSSSCARRLAKVANGIVAVLPTSDAARTAAAPVPSRSATSAA
mmetsp:Transcript_7826/g.23970  ORF Transcript_7826/g.23970 Transcript_7826/m.23970 type:complete len:206 (-) Transcript_7826:581-1198(-)